MRLIIKLIIIIFALFLLSFLPHGLGALIQGVILIALLGILVIVGQAAARDLNLFQIPWRKNWQSRSDSTPVRLRHVSYSGINVYYTMALNGGGLGLSFEFVRLVSEHFGRVGHVYEYCAGPGFIGFNLLANNLCDKLTLSDVNPAAIEIINKTIKDNHLEDRVTVYQSDCLDSIPEHESWDLVVSNPPWDLKPGNDQNLILNDHDARVHKQFFQDLPKFLNSNGSVVLVESHECTKKAALKKLIDTTSFRINQYFPSVPFLKLLTGLNGYKNTSKSLAISLRLALSLLEIYFVHIKLDPSLRSSIAKLRGSAEVTRTKDRPD